MTTKAKAKTDQLLVECGAILKRSTKHEVWSLPNGQKFTRGTTPSDDRADMNSLSDLRRLLGLTKAAATEGVRRIKNPTDGKAAPKIRYTRVFNATLAESLRLSGASEIALRERIAKLEDTLQRRTAYAQEQEADAGRLRGMLKLSVRENQVRRSEMFGCLGCRLRNWWQGRRTARNTQRTASASALSTTSR